MAATRARKSTDAPAEGQISFSPRAVRSRANHCWRELATLYPRARCALDFADPWQAVVSTVLSAQCTDARVNTVTPLFFSRWPGPAELADAPLEEIEEVIRPTGFFHNKARNLKAAATALRDSHGCRVPATPEELMSLPGVGRKTANVVLFAAFGINAGIAVDTHVKRVSYRLGLTRSTDPLIIEQDLLPLFPREDWGLLNLRMVMFGREICQARRPRCSGCPMANFCPRLAPPGR